jgi:hypothetical protein
MQEKRNTSVGLAVIGGKSDTEKDKCCFLGDAVEGW